MIEYIDTHTHLYDKKFEEDLEKVLERSLSSGVRRLITPGIDKEYYFDMMKLKQKYPDIITPAIGLHPTSIDDTWQQELLFIESELVRHKFHAIGEIGMDGYWSKEKMREQREAFIIQLEMAIKLDIPVIVHLRDATEEIFEAMASIKNRSSLRGVFHAFSGSIEMYRRIKKYGDFKVGIGGTVTFKNASIAKTVMEIDLSDILLETDSPWLTPVPYRGQRNEPSYIPIIAGKIATLKNRPIEEIASETTKNALNLFSLQ